MKINFKCKNKLNQLEINEFLDFQKIVAKKNTICFKIDIDEFEEIKPNKYYFLFKVNNDLIAYAIINSFDGKEAETTIIYEDKEFINEILEISINEIKKIKFEKMIFIIDEKDLNMIKIIKEYGFLYSFSEYRMFLNKNKFIINNNSELFFRDSIKSDTKELIELDYLWGNFDEDDYDYHGIKIATLNDKIIGKLRIEKKFNRAGIYGFVIKEKFRGRGFGRLMLEYIVNELILNNIEEIYLEVDTSNKIAFSLYNSVGFEVNTKFDYYIL